MSIMTGEQFDRLLDCLPFLDGSGRRRFVAGGIILIGIAGFNWNSIREGLGSLELKDLFTSPIIASGALLLVYAIGSITDLFGELFLVRAASGIFWGLDVATRFTTSSEGKLISALKVGVACFAVVPLAIWGLLLGLTGRTKYTIPLSGRLSREAQSVYESLPEKVAEGLREPVGDNSEVALKFITDRFHSEADKKWARRLVARAKDVATTTTALLVVLAYALVFGKLIGSKAPSPVAAEIRAILNDVRSTNPTAFAWMDLTPVRVYVDLGVPVEPTYLFSLEPVRLKDRIRELREQGRKTFELLRELKSRLRDLQALYKSEKQKRGQSPEDSRALENAIQWTIQKIQDSDPLTYHGARLPYAQRRLEVGEPVDEEFVGFLDHFLGSFGTSLDSAIPLPDDFTNKLRTYNQEVEANLQSKARLQSFLILASPLFCLLYFGFFASLRNAIRAILEALAQIRSA